jgi:luciferase-like monooxygenase
MASSTIGFALRYSVFSPADVRAAVRLLDQSSEPCPIFIPDGRGGNESIEVVSAILGQTKRVHAGSGVIRLLEHDAALLARRIQTIQAFSSNRCFLGIGTGSPGPNHAATIESMLRRLGEVRRNLEHLPQGVDAPEVWIAALRLGIAKKVMNSANGLVLNFCTPHHVSRMVEGLGAQRPKTLQLACYLKLFYSSRSDYTAKRLLVQEFLNYDSIPQYHEMFLQDRTAGALAWFKESNEWRTRDFDVPKELLSVSLANPRGEELRRYVESYRKAGLNLPVIYPYFPEDESEEFKLETVEGMLDAVA